MIRLGLASALVLSVGLSLAGNALADGAHHKRAHHAHRDRTPVIVVSTDTATGIIDTHGGKSLAPVVFSATHGYTTDTDVAPQDIDDGLMLAMALNLSAERRLRLLAVVPTYGNASLPADTMVARRIVRELKGRWDLPIVAGATGPVSQILHPTPTWFDGRTVTIEGHGGSFVAACRNAAVALMRKVISKSRQPVTLLAIGPVTDVACLMNTAPRAVLRNIREIIVIMSRVEGESLLVNGLTVNDFNFRMDPIAGALLLGAKRGWDVPIRLMSFSLTGQTSQQGPRLLPFNAETYPGPATPTPRSEASFRWLLAAAGPRNEYWSGIFGTEEGPFDQFALAAAIEPELFDCREARAYVQQCPYPPWSQDYPVDQNGNPTEIPYNAPDNPCVDHGPSGGSLSQVPAELVATLDTSDNGPLVRGTTGIDGNIPALDRPSRPVTACIDFASEDAFQRFKDLLTRYTW